MSLRNRSTSDGNGPIVSDGVTAHAVLVEVVADAVVVDDGPVGVSPQPNASAAPAAETAPMASRRVNNFELICPPLVRARSGTSARVSRRAGASAPPFVLAQARACALHRVKSFAAQVSA